MLAAAFHIVPSFFPRAYTKFLTPFKPDISNPAEPQLRCALYTSESCQISPVFLLTPEGDCDMGSKKRGCKKSLENSRASDTIKVNPMPCCLCAEKREIMVQSKRPAV